MFTSTELDTRLREIINEDAGNKGFLTAAVSASSIAAANAYHSRHFPRTAQAYLTGNGSRFYRLSGPDALVDGWRRGESRILDLRHPWDPTALITAITADTARLASSGYYTDDSVLPAPQMLTLDLLGWAEGSAAGLLGSAGLTVSIRFRAADVLTTATRALVSTLAGGELEIRNEVTTDEFRVYAGSTLILTALAAAYSPYYNARDWNVLTVIATSGNNTLQLNGVTIAASTTAWVPAAAAIIAVGARPGGTAPFKGDLDYVRVWSDITQTTFVARWEFEGNYNSTTAPANNLTAKGTGNRFRYDAPIDTGEYLIFRTVQPTLAQTVALLYTARHLVSGSEGAVTTTIPQNQFEAVATLAAHFAARVLADHYGHTSQASASFDNIDYQGKARTWADFAKQLMDTYLVLTGLDPFDRAYGRVVEQGSGLPVAGPPPWRT